MPKIEVSAEQAQALARGEDVTVAAPKPDRPPVVKHFVIVRKSGVVKAYDEVNGVPGLATIIRSPKGYAAIGTTTHRVTSLGDVVLEVKN